MEGNMDLAPGGQCMEFSRCPAGTKFSSHLGLVTYLLGSKLTLFSYGRDGHQPYSRGLGTHSKDFPMKGGMTIPHIEIFDPGTYDTGDWKTVRDEKVADFDYPKELHDLHNQYPLTPEVMKIKSNMLPAKQV